MWSWLFGSAEAPASAAAVDASQSTVSAQLRGGCPVQKSGGEAAMPQVDDLSATVLQGGCPVKGDRGGPAKGTGEGTLNPSNQMMVEERQRPMSGQTSPLPTNRRTSSIPKGDHTPVHQESEADKWQYPSQQMFFNAMKRKGHEPKEEEMQVVVGMHNAVNERTWAQLLEWERALHPSTADKVRLDKFAGDATNFSPKARFRNLLGYELPFDRHDWTISRDGEPVQYVIDYYSATPAEAASAPFGMYIDVRPCVKSVGGIIDRIRMSALKLERNMFAPSEAVVPPAEAKPDAN